MKILINCLIAAALLAGCSGETGPNPEIHDTKYVAVNAKGQSLDSLPESWPCVLDRFTGLTWQVKTDAPGLHDWRNTYSWYDPRESHDGELDHRGERNGGQCEGSGCDTDAYVNSVNQSGLCGHADWRLPMRDELASINDPRKLNTPPTANTQYFPHTQQGEYWSSNDYSYQWNSAWLWSFQYGHDRVEWKHSPRYVRLVRGEAQHLQRVKD